jgi:anti-sigma regulatory factor (Ser/Thr protein kinase)
MNTAENQIIRLNLQAKLEYLPGAVALVREITGKLGLPDQDSRRMELVVEEACVNVIEHAFEGEEGNFDIIIARRPGQIVIGVEDRGLPIDFKKLEEGQESGLGMVLMKAFADEVHFMNLGRLGKRVEMVKNLPEKNIESQLKELSKKPAAAPFGEADITVRRMRPEESASLARCAYRCYGYTYANDILYFPERVKALVASGMMISVVAVDPEGEIVGHVSVNKESPEALIGESGQAIVDPRYRGVGFHKQIGFMLAQFNKESGMVGTFGEAVTVHPYSQKSALTRGYVEMGILLGFVPPTMHFKSIQGESLGKRSPVLLLYKRLNDEPLRDVYLPTLHAGIMRRIYDNSKMRRNFASGPVPELPEKSRVDINVKTELKLAFLRVTEYGEDLEELIKFRLQELCKQRMDCIYLDLPLSSPATQRFCATMEMLGFFFGGILPELCDGDVLRMQYINNADLELADVQLATDFGRELLQYVLKAGGLTAGKIISTADKEKA